MTEVSDEELERLASRLAMMGGGEGEAASAGRAVAQLAQRLGLSGGALKEIFLRGAEGWGRPDPKVAMRAEIGRLESELGTLRKGLRLMEAGHRELAHERDALLFEVETLRQAVEVRNSRSRLRAVALGVAMLALLGAGLAGFVMSFGARERMAAAPVVRPAVAAIVALPAPAAPDYGPVNRRVGMVRNGRALAYREPERSAGAVATLAGGAPVVVRRVFFVRQLQWAEVEVGPGIGYVLVSDIDLS